jgi:hypothetical protein
MTIMSKNIEPNFFVSLEETGIDQLCVAGAYAEEIAAPGSDSNWLRLRHGITALLPESLRRALADNK